MKIQLNNVRLSYPNLFQPKASEGSGKPKYSANFILDKKKHAALIKEIQLAIETIQKEQLKGKSVLGVCLKDGSLKQDTDGYGPDIMFVSASNEARRPVVDRNISPITEQDGKIYAGCYVNATIRLWAQDNKYGRRVNADLRAVQFVKDGDSFGESRVNVEDEFAPLDDEL